MDFNTKLLDECVWKEMTERAMSQILGHSRWGKEENSGRRQTVETGASNAFRTSWNLPENLPESWPSPRI